MTLLLPARDGVLGPKLAPRGAPQKPQSPWSCGVLFPPAQTLVGVISEGPWGSRVRRMFMAGVGHSWLGGPKGKNVSETGCGGEVGRQRTLLSRPLDPCMCPYVTKTLIKCLC